ncbi:MAG: hypothetical protein Tsb0017_01320 [Geothermobacteraceae bacterium]
MNPNRPAIPELNRPATLVWLALFAAALAWSGWRPYDRFTWFLEVAPALIALVLLAATRRRFPLTPLCYGLILLHSVILMVGGKYTYAQVPLFNWLKDVLDLGRNHYDKVGHLAQGFIPALVAREILLRTSPLQRGGWLFTIVTCICLAVSAFYELIEWWVAELSGTAAEAFLGTQGYVWDTQSDMFMALVGAICGQLLLARLQDRQLEGAPPAPRSPTGAEAQKDETIRIAAPKDWPRIVAIYNQAVEERHCTADLEPATLESRRDWLETHLDERYPILVLEQQGQILGWCSLSPWRKGRKALEGVAEVSYYLDRAARGRGLASRLLRAALAHARGHRFHTLIAILMEVNEPSLKLLQRFGFQRWGRLPDVALWPDGSRCGQLIYGLRLDA